MHEKWRDRLLGTWSRLLCGHPIWTLMVALALAAGSIIITLYGWPVARLRPLHFQADRNALISEDLPWNQHFINWNRQFLGTRDFTIVVDPYPDNSPDDPQRVTQARALTHELARKLRLHPDVERLDWGFDSSAVSPRAIRMLDMERFSSRLMAMEQAVPVLQSASPDEFLTHLVNQLQAGGRQESTDDLESALSQLTQLVLAMGAVIQDGQQQTNYFERVGGDPDDPLENWNFLASENGRLYFLRITPRKQHGALNEMEQAIRSIRQVLAEVTPQYPDIAAGLTGIEVVEADETDAVTRDSAIASLVACLLISALMISAFHSWRTPLLAMVSLLFGIAWSFGYLTVAIGHLQVLSVVFTVILLGIGIDFGIHLATRLELVRHDFPDTVVGFRRAMRNSFEVMGPGIITGAVTTSAAFMTTMFTDFRGVGEMGHIAAVGVLLCLVAMFSVFPAFLRLVKPRHRDVVPMRDRFFHFFEERWVMPFSNHPRTTLALATLVAILAMLAASRMSFNYDLMALMPRHLDSLHWQRRVEQSAGRSIWFGISIAKDLEDARRKVQAFRSKPTIDPNIAGIGYLFPRDETEKIQALESARKRLEGSLAGAADSLAPEADPPPATGPGLGLKLALLRRMLQNAMPQAPGNLQPVLARLGQVMDETVNALNALDDQQRTRQLAYLDQCYAEFRSSTAQRIAAALDPSPLTPEDLPPGVLRTYRGTDGTLALEIYPRLPEGKDRVTSPLAPSFLPKFVGDMASVDPNATGVIVQVYRSGQLIEHAYFWAGVYALIVVFLLVLLDFRSIVDALMCLAPVAVGFAMTFAVMWLVGMTVNPANIIVLPLMFGIGVDAGVHIMHRYRMDPVGRPLGLTSGTGKGITITSFATMIGFGAMMLASHRGISSLGFVLTIGMGLTLLACWVIMPAWLELRTRKS